MRLRTFAPMPAALRNRKFVAYLLSAGLADSGFWVASVAQGWLVLQLTNSPLWLGIVSGMGQVPYLLFSIAGGELADRFDRPLLIALGNLLALSVNVAIALWIGKPGFGVATFALLQFLFGTVLALEHPVDRAWLYDLVRGRMLGSSIALSSLEWAFARTAGPALGGAIIATVGVVGGFWSAAALALPLAVVALILTRGKRAAPQPTKARSGTSPSGLAPVVYTFSLLVTAFTVGVSPYISLLPDIAKNHLHLGAGGYGLLAASGGIGAIAAALALSVLGELRYKGRLVAACSLAGALLLFAFVHAESTWLAAVLLFAAGGIDTAMYALANTLVQEHSSDEHRGRANAVFSLAFLGGLPIGNVFVGVLAGKFGSLAALSFSSLAVVASCIAFFAFAPKARDAA